MALPLLGRYRGVVPFHPSFNSATFPLRENKRAIPFQNDVFIETSSSTQ